jgi:NAD(P)-dependent dehydrogenase (short-subunit alcohol dehydrogenase family)
MTQTGEITFKRSDIELFAKLSHDVNPLHVRPDYARRTPFGQCVVYGILGVLGALRELFREAPVHLKSIDATFVRPLFLDTTYQVLPKLERHGLLEVSLARSEGVKLVVRVEYEAAACPPWTSRLPTPDCPSIRREPNDFDPAGAPVPFSGDYAISGEHIGERKDAIGLRHSCIHPLQLAALCWSSYLVGMEFPGRQALFRSLHLEFVAPPADDNLDLRYEGNVDSFGSETSMLGMSARLSDPRSGRTFATAKIGAAHRPPPVEYSLDQLQSAVGRSGALAGKLALVTGSSRGLGSQIALGCCLHGADLIVHCRDRIEDANRIAATAESLGSSCTVCRGDLHLPKSWSTLLDEVRSRGGTLDIFVNNAFQPVIPLAFGELTKDLVDDRICAPIRSAVEGLQRLLPTLGRNACVVNISSEWTRKPPKEFSHYVAAKAAAEGLVLALASEYPSIRFITVRPPKLLTDMTNDIIPGMRGQSPEGVVATILKAIENPAGTTNHAIVEGL